MVERTRTATLVEQALTRVQNGSQRLRDAQLALQALTRVKSTSQRTRTATLVMQTLTHAYTGPVERARVGLLVEQSLTRYHDVNSQVWP